MGGEGCVCVGGGVLVEKVNTMKKRQKGREDGRVGGMPSVFVL